jgi:hypothetical protein
VRKFATDTSVMCFAFPSDTRKDIEECATLLRKTKSEVVRDIVFKGLPALKRKLLRRKAKADGKRI